MDSLRPLFLPLNLLRLYHMEADRPFPGTLGHFHQLPNRADHMHELLVMLPQMGLDFIHPSREFRIYGQNLPQPDKRPHDLDIDRDRTRAAEYTGEHGHALFGEGVGGVTAATPPTVCV